MRDKEVNLNNNDYIQWANNPTNTSSSGESVMPGTATVLITLMPYG